MVKKGQVYAELGGKKRYLRVDDVTEDTVVCTAGWRARGTEISWSRRMPVLVAEALSDAALYRLETDAEE